MEAEKRIAAVIREYEAQGLHRTGTAVDDASGEWLAGRVREAGLGHTVTPEGKPDDRPSDTLFLHPETLGGMMLGISRPTMGWQWSGHPERVEQI